MDSSSKEKTRLATLRECALAFEIMHEANAASPRMTDAEQCLYLDIADMYRGRQDAISDAMNGKKTFNEEDLSYSKDRVSATLKVFEKEIPHFTIGQPKEGSLLMVYRLFHDGLTDDAKKIKANFPEDPRKDDLLEIIGVQIEMFEEAIQVRHPLSKTFLDAYEYGTHRTNALREDIKRCPPPVPPAPKV